MKFSALATAAALGLGGLAPAARASVIEAPVPRANHIEYGGSDWAWASPCSFTNPETCDWFDLTYQSAFGWRLPTQEEVAATILSDLYAFVSAFRNEDGSVVCASAWFSYVHGADACDIDEALTGNITGAPWANAGSDTFLIRSSISAVPLPGAALLLLGGLGALGLVRRRSSPASA